MGRCGVDVGSMWGRCEVDVWSMRSAYSFSRNQRVYWFLCHLNASTPANMNCQYCRKIFASDYNLRRHEDEYCPDRDNNGKECSPPKKSRDADEASISSNESMGTHASHDDVDEDTKMKAVLETVLTRKRSLDYIDQRSSVQGVGSVQRDLARASHGGP